MRSPQGSTITYAGGYPAVHPARSIEMSWPACGREDLQTTLHVEFRPSTPGETTVVLTQTGLPDAASRADHVAGWAGVLDQLVAAVTRGRLE